MIAPHEAAPAARAPAISAHEAARAPAISAHEAARYGLLGLPLAFVALPLYVQLPAHYATEFGVPLAALGVLLLVARLADACVDPWIGRFADRLFARSAGAVLAAGFVAALMLAAGFTALVFPPVRGEQALLAWAAGALALTYGGYSMLSVAHQAWGAMLAGTDVQRARIVGWREGFALAGVVAASTLPTAAGWAATVGVLVLALAIGWTAWWSGRRPVRPGPVATGAWWLPFAHAPFRRLLAVFVINGVASAVPATLLVFFLADRLQVPTAMQPLFLVTYFLCAAISLPLWLRLVRSLGLARTWLAGMVLTVAAFGWTALLGAGDAWPFVAICAATGLALGADLAMPSALLARVIATAPGRGGGEGVFFGWWNFATKLNLALAAGLALPLLGLAGYTPGTRDAEALSALAAAYCLLPAGLKLAAAVLLYVQLIRPERVRGLALPAALPLPTGEPS